MPNLAATVSQLTDQSQMDENRKAHINTLSAGGPGSGPHSTGLHEKWTKALDDAKTPQDLGKVKRAWHKGLDNGDPESQQVGSFMSKHKETKERIAMTKSPSPTAHADARMDRLLRSRPSSGRAIARKF